jgi:hypothetical protein
VDEALPNHGVQRIQWRLREIENPDCSGGVGVGAWGVLAGVWDGKAGWDGEVGLMNMVG